MAITKTNLGEKHIVKVTFHKKRCDTGDVILSLDITNLLSESLKLVLIFMVPSFL
jgi:hypothetical protein